MELLLQCFTNQMDLLQLGMTFCTPEDYECMTSVVELICNITRDIL